MAGNTNLQSFGKKSILHSAILKKNCLLKIDLWLFERLPHRSNHNNCSVAHRYEYFNHYFAFYYHCDLIHCPITYNSWPLNIYKEFLLKWIERFLRENYYTHASSASIPIHNSEFLCGWFSPKHIYLVLRTLYNNVKIQLFPSFKKHFLSRI